MGVSLKVGRYRRVRDAGVMQNDRYFGDLIWFHEPNRISFEGKSWDVYMDGVRLKPEVVEAFNTIEDEWGVQIYRVELPFAMRHEASIDYICIVPNDIESYKEAFDDSDHSFFNGDPRGFEYLVHSYLPESRYRYRIFYMHEDAHEPQTMGQGEDLADAFRQMAYMMTHGILEYVNDGCGGKSGKSGKSGKGGKGSRGKGRRGPVSDDLRVANTKFNYPHAKQVQSVSDLDGCYAYDELRSELEEKVRSGDYVMALAYSDYGGNIYNRAVLEFFSLYNPDNVVVMDVAYNGKSGFIFSDDKDFLDTEVELATDEYLSELEGTLYREEFEQVCKDLGLDSEDTELWDFVEEWFMEAARMEPNSLDYSYDDLKSDLREEGYLD